MKDVSIDVNATGIGTFVVGGVDISRYVERAYLIIVAGRITRVEFEVTGDVHLDAKQTDVTLRRKA